MRRALGRAPTSGEVSRGLDRFFQEVTNEIWLSPGGSQRLLQSETLVLLTEGAQRYDLPTDYAELLDLTVLDGTDRDTLQSATSTTATLAATDATEPEGRIGRELVTLSGTGSGQKRTIFGWTAPQATSLSAPWTTTPGASTTYVVVDTYRKLDPLAGGELESFTNRTSRERPTKFRVTGTSYDVWPVPDKTYPAILRYWINLTRLDWNSSAFDRVLTDWQTLLTQGVYVKTLLDEQDTLYDGQFAVYLNMIRQLVGKGTRDGFLASGET